MYARWPEYCSALQGLCVLCGNHPATHMPKPSSLPARDIPDLTHCVGCCPYPCLPLFVPSIHPALAEVLPQMRPNKHTQLHDRPVGGCPATSAQPSRHQQRHPLASQAAIRPTHMPEVHTHPVAARRALGVWLALARQWHPPRQCQQEWWWCLLACPAAAAAGVARRSWRQARRCPCQQRVLHRGRLGCPGGGKHAFNSRDSSHTELLQCMRPWLGSAPCICGP